MWQSSWPASIPLAGQTPWPNWLERWLVTLSVLSIQVQNPVVLLVPGCYINNGWAFISNAIPNTPMYASLSLIFTWWSMVCSMCWFWLECFIICFWLTMANCVGCNKLYCLGDAYVMHRLQIKINFWSTTDGTTNKSKTAKVNNKNHSVLFRD